MNKEIIVLRIDLIKKLSIKNFNLSENLTAKQKETLHHYVRYKPFKIIQCDKNVGSMLITHDDHNKLAFDHLLNNNTYKEVNNLEFDSIYEKINSTINNLYENNHMNKQVFEKIKLSSSTDYSPGKFRILSKIHKKEFGIRPIVNCSNHLTRKLCILIHTIINPYVQSIKHILKDSQQLLQTLENFKSQKNMHLYTCDFESLYTNIKAEHAVTAISLHILRHTNLLQQYQMSIIGFRKILDLIFTCNIFKYDKIFFLQLIGLPMGCVCGPSVANLYVYILEKEWLVIHNNELIYFRFIDDIFIASLVPINLNEFKIYFLYLKLNIEYNDIVIFLDLKIMFDIITGHFIFSLYIKPTHSFGFLLTSSNHPNFIFHNIVVSLFIRIKRTCTRLIDFYYFARILYMQLIKRNYNYKMLNGIIRNISKIDRNKLLPYKCKNDNFLNSNSFNLFMKFDINNHTFKNILYYTYNEICKHHSILNNKKIMIVNRIKTNIGSMLIHGFKFDKIKKFLYKKCFNANCRVCKFSSNYHYLHLYNLFLPFQNNSSCNSNGFNYILICNKCKCYYIGESFRTVKERISEHLNDINNYKISKTTDIINTIIDDDKWSNVAKHFNEKDHNIDEHFKFCIFDSNVINDECRLSIETDLINIFKSFNLKILNDKNKQPSIYTIKYLTFLK